MSSGHHPSSPEIDHAAVLRLLHDPTVYSDRPGEVRVVETHISQVFLTERFVYKLKKPVRFDFLDFTTLEKREWDCREELRLNRRMTHDVYLDVLPVTRESSGELKLAGSGHAVDWVVKMRRLPAARMLDELIGKDRLSAFDVRRLADYLGRYYAATQPLMIGPDEFHAALVTHTTANFRTLSAAADVDPVQVRRIHTSQLRMLKCRPELFHSRILDGRVIDGHGDLRPEHVCLIDPPAVFDCVEFSADLRRIDTLDELCFLAMECDALDATSTGQCILDAYLTQSHDRPPPELIAFYKCYRACVRAKIAALRAVQMAADARMEQRRLRDRYLNLAERYLRDAAARPLAVLVTGLMGTGKSTFARALADEIGAEVLRTDVLRDALFPADGRSDAFGEGRYQPDVRDRVYDELLRQAGRRLAAGSSVILDGTFSKGAYRDEIIRRGCEAGADVFIVECVCPREVAMQRIESRLHRSEGDASEARPELYDQQVAERSREGTLPIDFQVHTIESAIAEMRRLLTALPPPFADVNGS